MNTPNNDTHQRILDVAEELFSKRGYSAVRLRDIADAVGMKHASLYYYAPQGKTQLFIAVMERNFARHREGISAAIAGAGDDLRDQMMAVSRWLVNQPPLDLTRMAQADSLEISPEQAERLMELAYEAVRVPIVAALERAVEADEIVVPDLELAAMALVSLVGSVHSIPDRYVRHFRERLGIALVDMLLQGWLKR